MEKSLSLMDLSFEEMRIVTSHSDYYLYQQELFVDLYKGDKIYRKKS